MDEFPVQGPGQQLESLEIDLLLRGIARRYGYDFRQYARASLTRRIRQIMEREGASSVSALLERVLHDQLAMARFVEDISVHTTSMFRDADVYRALRREVIPLLRTYPFVRIWHAGCSTGEEVYSLAILLHEEGLYDRCRIYATDISDRVLERARKGIFPLRVIRESTSAYRIAGGQRDFSSYYVADREHAIFRAGLRKQILFSQHNLVSDGTFNEFNLVMCRNVLIYFDQQLRDRAHELFHASLSNFGILALGKKESLRFTRLEPHYQELGDNLRIYRRTR
jgi:chemotaxis protein methyltransferase CheR